MEIDSSDSQTGWDEQLSRTFIDYGRYFIPERERQIQTIASLVPAAQRAESIIDLCCGEGLLAEAILERCPGYTVVGLDNSKEMLQSAQSRLKRFGMQFQTVRFDIFARKWPACDSPLRGLISSLAIHHLDGDQKQALFREIYSLLAEGGFITIADLVEAAHPSGKQLAANAWDDSVKERSLNFDGNRDRFSTFEDMHWNMYRYFDPEDIDKPSRLFDQLKWLEQAGFVDIDVYWMWAGHVIFGGWKAG